MATRTQDDQGRLFPGERRDTVAGLPLLAYYRAGDPARPLLVFLTGGGILARVAYGHPGSDHRDFPDYWLAQRGWGLLAPSYPSDHPATGPPVPDLGIADWARVIARAIARRTLSHPDRTIVVTAWSMGGKIAFALTRALRELGLVQACLVSLAATPPFPGLAQRMTTLDGVTGSGLRTLTGTDARGVTRDERWRAELTAIGAGQGRPVIEPDAFLSLYRCAIPPRLCGPETEPVIGGGPATDLRTELLDANSFAVGDYPLCACVVPRAATDPWHALTDEAIWAGVTARGLSARYIPAGGFRSLSDTGWTALRRVVVTAPRRLSRRVDGGHFFFLGERGAGATVAAIAGLTEEATDVIATIEHILTRHTHQSAAEEPTPTDQKAG